MAKTKAVRKETEEDKVIDSTRKSDRVGVVVECYPCELFGYPLRVSGVSQLLGATRVKNSVRQART